MSPRRQFVFWVVLAGAAILIFAFIFATQRETTQRRWATGVAPKPAQGSALFREKGCAHCHGASADGSRLGPPLRQRASLASLSSLVTALWNHAPHMYEAMNAAHLPYPSLTYDETGQLVAYLFLVGHADAPGDPARGRQLFESKHCARCHGAAGVSAPAIASLGRADDPLALTQSLWNHASGMEESMQRLGAPWPRLEANELRDLFAYLRQAGGASDVASVVPAGDPDRGWRVFREKSCINCHAIRPTGGAAETPNSTAKPIAPALGAESRLPATLSEFGESMLNHFPNMHRAMKANGAAPPTFNGKEMTDLTVFLFSLHYLEPVGSPHVGATIFSWRGCADCHGTQAEGGKRGPALRGRGQTYTAIRLAGDLWGHGARMYEQSRKLGQGWPLLEEGDVGDLLSFLNTPVEHSSGR